MYSSYIIGGKDLVDCLNVLSKTEAMYECTNVGHSYKIKYSQFNKACVDCAFIYDCKNCTDCFMSAGLVNKKYCYKNKQYERDEYLKILESYKLDTFSGVEKAQKEYDEFLLTQKRRPTWTINNNVNVSGDIIGHSKNVHDSYIARECENCRFCNFASGDKDSYDLVTSGELSECYEGIVLDHSQLNFFGIFSVKSQDIRYTQHCHSSKHLFGCIGIRNGKYSILNKEYSKDEYEALVPKVIEHMNAMPYVDQTGNYYKFGEFFPIELSPFGYNETVAHEHFPLTMEVGLQKGYRWEENIQKTAGRETLSAKNIPDSIHDVEDDILEQVLACTGCERNYKIVQNELIFYRKMGIPIPRRCFYCRHEARFKRTNPFKLWHRQCTCGKANHFHGEGKCKVEFETSYAPDRPEIVYCEKCYQAEVY